jgi:predicted permease
MTVLQVIFPIFALALVGYLVARLNVFSAEHIDGISRFVFNIALPALLFRSLAGLELPVEVNWQFLFSYYAVVLLIYALGIWTSKQWFLHSPQEQGIFGLGASYSNMLLVGLPIISAGLGDDALLPLFLLVSVHSATLFLIVTILVEGANRADGSVQHVAAQTIRTLAMNPIIISLALGLLFNLLNLSLPRAIDDTLSMLSDATLPCALFVLGASLNTYKIAGRYVEAVAMIGLKLVLQPILVWLLAFTVFHLDPLWGAVAVMAAGMPVGINAYLFAQKYQIGIATISTAILLSTLLAVISQSVMLAVFM